MGAANRPSWALGWKLAFFIPLAVALALILVAQTRDDLHLRIALILIGNICGTLSLIAQAVYWITVRKWTGWGIAMLIFVSAVLGFGIHALLHLG